MPLPETAESCRRKGKRRSRMSEFASDARRLLELVGGRENIVSFDPLCYQDEVCPGR